MLRRLIGFTKLAVIFTVALCILAGLSLVLALWQWLAMTGFPLHKRVAKTSFTPAITLLKPLKGCDSETEACLRSWLQQMYDGDVQALFGVASADDPVCELVRRLIAENPKCDAELLICAEALGPNAKVSTLIQLERHAKHDIVIVSDADVRVPADFLANIVHPLEADNVGVVNCFYKFANPSTIAMQWEAIAVNADFWSQVLQSQMMKPIDFALGAVMATRRENLRAIGGFESLVEYLADDYQLGHRIAKRNKRIVISPLVVECWESPKTFKQIWNHQLRWTRTIRVCQPVPFFFSILHNATLWPLLLSIWLFVKEPPLDWKFAIIPLLVVLPLRIHVALKAQEKLTGRPDHYIWFWLTPIKDLLNVPLWALAFLGNKIDWRGDRYRVDSGGKLVR